ncbi:hypothetical protein HY483_03345 [Candidatus Woesearchaeota archaeon]|nr:hypothetical protein [Candidatus Woesearchaeota archaeon]
MADPRILRYVQSLKQRGAKKSDVKEYLRRYGYSSSDVNSAINSVYGGSTKIVILFLLLAAAIGIIFLLYNGGEELVITLVVDSPAEVLSGSSAVISTTVTSSVRALINIDVSLRDGSGSIVFSDSSQKSFSGSATKKFGVSTKDFRGEYSGTIIVSSGDISVRKNFVLYVKDISNNKPSSASKNVSDSGGFVSGIPKDPVKISCGSCVAPNSCSVASCIYGKCVITYSGNCCGNLQCEPGETTKSCPQDCVFKDASRTDDDILADAKQFAKSNVERSKSLCASLSDSKKNSCLIEVARISAREDVCSFISSDNEQSTCYITLVLDHEKIDVCKYIKSVDERDQCINLANLIIAQKNNNVSPS